MNNEQQFSNSNYKLTTYCRDQYEFQSRCIDDLIPEDHKARTVWDFVSNMDLRACFETINSFKGQSGRNAIDPKILLTLWIYTIIDGNCSARKLEELCKNHNVYKWICAGVSVNRTSLAEFRSLNPRKFDDLLTKCLAVMVKNGLISDSDFSQDGTRIKANAGNNSFHRENSLKKLEEEMIVYIEHLTKEEKANPDAYEQRKLQTRTRHAIDKKNRVASAIRSLEEARCEKIVNNTRSRTKVTEKDLSEVRASTTDPEVRRMKLGDGGFRLAYNVQFATGLDSRVIYGVDVVKTLDPGTQPRLMYQVQERLKKLNLAEIKRWIADAAYSAKNDIITVAALFKGCFYYAPPKPKKGADPKKYLKSDCEVIKKWRDSIDSEEAIELYRKRCSTAEFSNMQVKNHGLNAFLVRGLLKVKGMSFLHAIAMNVIRYFDFLKQASGKQ